jgi:type II secretory pathway pseudopilin PulG
MLMKGFTLIETVVVVAITMILSGIVLAYSRSTERQILLYRDQAFIVGVINRAKSLAVQKYHETQLSGRVNCAFGVHFAPPRSFILFQDLDQGSCPANRTYAYDQGEEIQTLSLDNHLQFDMQSNLDILFIPPELQATTTNPTGFPVTIVIKTNDDTRRATTTVSAAGQITQ